MWTIPAAELPGSIADGAAGCGLGHELRPSLNCQVLEKPRRCRRVIHFEAIAKHHRLDFTGLAGGVRENSVIAALTEVGATLHTTRRA